MKEIKKYYPDHHKIKKIFKLFPDPEIELTRHKHNLWPYYYREHETLNYYTELIKKYDCINLSHTLVDRLYGSHYYLRKNMISIFSELKQKFNNKNSLINEIYKTLTSNYWFYRFDGIEFLFLKYYEYSSHVLTEIYFVYCVIIYCPEEGKQLLDDIESYM